MSPRPRVPRPVNTRTADHADHVDYDRAQLDELAKEQFNYRMQRSTGQLGQPHLFRQTRKDIARIKTVLEEKSRDA